MKEVSLAVSSEDSVQIQFPQKICEEVNADIKAFVENLKEYTSDIPQIIEIVPTYCAVTVYFDCDEIKRSGVVKIIEEVLEKTGNCKTDSKSGGRLVEIPVCYEDEEFAPDLADVASYTGLSKEEVIKLHHSKDYLIYMLGFLPGFPYLGGMDEQLETPRLETPRTKIPAGSVAIGGKQAGLYPSDSPGGWRIIGRTPLKVFDQNRNPACLYEAGDRIRFVPITRAEFEEIAAREKADNGEGAGGGGDVSGDVHAEDRATAKISGLPKYVCISGLKILDGGMCTTVQDKGRLGFQHTGIGQSGVMDAESFARGNAILGNEENAACLETTVLGPSIEFVLPCEFVITGGECNATLNGKPVLMNKKYFAGRESILKCGFITKGLRSYICFKGGILVPEIFGSRATNLKSQTGGLNGRKILAGDELAIGESSKKSFVENQRTEASCTVESFDASAKSGEPLVLNCTKGSQFSDFSDEAVKKFQKDIYTVLPDSDRMGIRFSGESLNCGKTDIISDAIPFGAVQITSAGLPVVMAADRQTTGGYAKIASVTRHSMCLLAQAVPGTKVRFLIGD